MGKSARPVLIREGLPERWHDLVADLLGMGEAQKRKAALRGPAWLQKRLPAPRPARHLNHKSFRVRGFPNMLQGALSWSTILLLTRSRQNSSSATAFVNNQEHDNRVKQQNQCPQGGAVQGADHTE